MPDDEEREDSKGFISFPPTTGSPIHVGRRDRAERIREAISDLRLAIDGCVAQPPEDVVNSVGSLARQCSIFLRKMVLDDNRNLRLLDHDTCQALELTFDRIRKIAHDRKSITLVLSDLLGGLFEATKLDEATGEPLASHFIPIGPQRLSFEIEWPLPGFTNWQHERTRENPWEVRTEGLFDSDPRDQIECEPWLGQQVVIFDNQGINLGDIIKLTANTEGAHSPPVDRLMKIGDQEDSTRFRVDRDTRIHILNNFTVCGFRYNHIIVIQAALYLYTKLIGNTDLVSDSKEVDIPVFGVVPDDVSAAIEDFLHFDGGLMLSLSESGQHISHRVRAPR
ncbi:MAG: hypothetical protein F4Z02_03075 [Acidimicrobiia bacterium]|nr:hypothetical protein [Acidimicrobiia bacterium]MYG71576.1 hypothetical protein [Acidimicrobiia bacterium]